MSDWQAVRCKSPTCDLAQRGGRVLFTRKRNEDGTTMVVKVWKTGGKSGSLVVLGDALGAICLCGAEWRNTALMQREGVTLVDHLPPVV